MLSEAIFQADFMKATEISGSVDKGFTAALMARLSRTLCLLLRRQGLRPSVMTAKLAQVSSPLYEALIDGLLLGGAEVEELGTLSLAEFELCQHANRCSAALFLSAGASKGTAQHGEGTFLEATQEDAPVLEEASGELNDPKIEHGLALFIQQVPQIGERLKTWVDALQDTHQVTGKASYRRGHLKNWIPTPEAADALRAQMHSKTVVETSS